ncbi:MAG: hypothetical protein ACK4Q5_08940 [Saprospiraceae bacterium]
MILCQKLRPALFACAVLWLVGCKAVIHFNSTATQATPPAGKFSKILFVEEMGDMVAYKFYNNVRRDLRRELAARKIQCEFVRTTPTMADPGGRIADAMGRFQPDAVVRLTDCEVDDYVWLDIGWGPFHDDAHEITVEMSLRPAGSDSVLWTADLFVDQFFGVDVASEKVARRMVEKLAADGMIRD